MGSLGSGFVGAGLAGYLAGNLDFTGVVDGYVPYFDLLYDASDLYKLDCWTLLKPVDFVNSVFFTPVALVLISDSFEKVTPGFDIFLPGNYYTD